MADLRLVETRILRTPAAGPEPCNTLAFLRCLVPGMDVGVAVDGETVRTVVSFQTEFRLDGYLQSQFEWYKANTLVSATASLKALNTTTDLTFLLAVDKVEAELRQLDGSLAFHVTCAAMMQNDALFAGHEEVVLTAALTAYVLCFEPRAERPPSGAQRTPWRLFAEEAPRISDLLRMTQRSKLRAEMARERPCD
jgi:hypothetical protein